MAAENHAVTHGTTQAQWRASCIVRSPMDLEGLLHELWIIIAKARPGVSFLLSPPRLEMEVLDDRTDVASKSTIGQGRDASRVRARAAPLRLRIRSR